MWSRLKKAFSGAFVRHVFVLLGGTAVAHAVTLLALPVLTRLYSPEEFGVSGVFVALLGIVSVGSAWRYEIALPLPRDDASATNLLVVALCCVALTTAGVTLLVAFFGPELAALTKTEKLASYIWWLPVGVALTAASEVFRYWAIRKKAFARVARARVEQALGGVTAQLALGWAGSGALGLIIGNVISHGLSLFSLGRRAFAEDRDLLRGVSVEGMATVARDYDRFPKYSTGEAFANVAAVQLPLILIASLAASSEVGYLMLGMRLMQAPLGLIGSSISQVFYTTAVEQHHQGQLGVLTARSVGNLARIGVGPLVFAGIASPALFGLAFGREWQRAGELVAWMTPWFVFQFLASPVSMVLQVTSRQRTALLLQVAGLILRVSMVAMVAYLGRDCYAESYAMSGWIFYLCYLLVICRAAEIPLSQIARACGRAAPFVAAWAGAGLALRTLI